MVIPGAAIGLVAYRMASQALVDRAGVQLTVLARDVGNEIGGVLAEQRHDVDAWARQEVMRDIVVDDIDKRIAKLLASITASYPAYREVFVVADGHVVAASDPARLRTGDRQVPTNGGVPLWEDGPRERTFELRAVIPDPEAPTRSLGTLVARYDWSYAMEPASRLKEGLGGSGLTVDFVVLDPGGHVVGDTAATRSTPIGPTPAELGWTAAAELVDRAQPRFALEPSLGAVVAYVPATGDPPSWPVLALQARDEALAAAYHMRHRVALVLAGVLGVALGVASLLANRMIRPLRMLTAATRELAAMGDLASPIRVRSADEIGELSAAFNTAAGELKRARADLVAASKLAFVGELAAGMAHEIRTPLGILRSSAQMLERASDSAAAERRELAGMMIEEVDRLDRVVAGLTDLARPRSLALQATPLSDLIGRALDFVAGQAADKGLVVRRFFAADLPPAHCDPDEIYQVALNLIVNAIQHTPAGGVVLARTFAPRARWVAFEVTDTGTGLSPERQQQIFTPFVSFREGGTGLGLALAQRTVLAHRGSITVRSTPGYGATFTVELPAIEGTS